jgi:tryptophan synthase alpha chain
MPDLEKALRERRDAGGRAFIPYVTGGFPGVDPSLLRALQDTGADAVEVGIPFSDPVMDGGVIQEASRLALEAGALPSQILETIAEASLDVPVAVMTYVNPVYRRGYETFLGEVESAGVAGVIVPDLPVDEAGDWTTACAAHGVASVQLAAPGTAPDRLAWIARVSSGFLYCVATYGVTGVRTELAATARELIDRLRPLTDLPLVLGVGVGSPSQAAEVGRFSDGAVVGTALMAKLLEGDREGMVALAAEFRAALPVT